ncbi:hydroperoxide isomerase ALOXE3 [Clupea harengus]|uniref:Hydroperoxide isomerase ALOXE3 n=1 Tax=Clupea harengus TaxID=7950 RepID=A0A6P8FVB0_CLUHA|nr:hydroperoxide isomerase ALOXE3 [Clupea harengus]
MATYHAEVTTGSMIYAGTTGHVFITLIGTEGESERIRLNNFGRFTTETTWTFTVSTPFTLGSLLLVKLEKKQYLPCENEWFCSKVHVTTPGNDVVHFPCYSWLSNGEEIELRAGKAKKAFEEEHPLLISHRKKELERLKQLYQWKPFMEGLPDIINAEDALDLPAEIRFSFTKSSEILFTRTEILATLSLKGLIKDTSQWDRLGDIKKAFRRHKTPISEYIQDHWMEDDFFGYQLLNGYNPMAIQRCNQLPCKFAVTDEMVKPFLERGSSLTTEMQKGNIFLCDFRRIAGLPAPIINGKQQYIAAPLCLLYKNPEDKLLPIAIQLNQEPSQDNPVFLPSDSEYDWLLAKTYLRNADFHEHQTNSHYLRTHGLSEAFIVSTLRNLPRPHPMYKLLIPHTRYTLQINTTGRVKLFGPEGIYTKATNLGGQGQFDIMKRWFSEVTYSSLCLPEDIRARGLESIPNFYYRDDGLKLWEILNRYVRSMVELYYPSDLQVQQDSELQNWIKDIFIHGFLGQARTGIPDHFCAVEEVTKFITMVIFDMSAQHSAVNGGQFDYGGWLPNSPNSMQRPAPTTKGHSTERTLLETLPDISTSVNGAVFRWLLSSRSTDFIPLGCFPDEHFCEDAPLRIIKQLQSELALLTQQIRERNKSLAVPYLYLCPTEMENSASM